MRIKTLSRGYVVRQPEASLSPFPLCVGVGGSRLRVRGESGVNFRAKANTRRVAPQPEQVVRVVPREIGNAPALIAAEVQHTFGGVGTAWRRGDHRGFGRGWPVPGAVIYGAQVGGSSAMRRVEPADESG